MSKVIRGLIFRFDDFLRRLYDIHEFTWEEDCIFRLARKESKSDLTLSDGTKVRKGEAIGELHLWNERVPPMGAEGPNLRWGLEFYRLTWSSLVHLAEYVEREPQWKEIQTFGGETAFNAQEGLERIAKFMGRGGLDLEPLGRAKSPIKPFFEFWENIYNWALIWAYNPTSLRSKKLIRLQRARIWISRRTLLERYGRMDPAER